VSGVFDIAADASLNMTAGAAAACGSGAYTIVVLVRPTTGNNNCGFCRMTASGVQRRGFIEAGLALFGDADFSAGFGALTQGAWWVVAQSKAAGLTNYRHHLWAYAADGSGAMSHGVSSGSSTFGDPQAVDQIRLGIGDVRGNGLIAAAGFWTRALADVELDTLCSNLLTTWSALSPAELFSLENWNGTTGIETKIGSSSQSSITGSVGVGANPPSFNFALASSATISASTVTGAAVVPTPTVKTSATISPSVISRTVSIPTPTVVAVVTGAGMQGNVGDLHHSVVGGVVTSPAYAMSGGIV
jgi:hypothetical protein